MAAPSGEAAAPEGVLTSAAVAAGDTADAGRLPCDSVAGAAPADDLRKDWIGCTVYVKRLGSHKVVSNPLRRSSSTASSTKKICRLSGVTLTS